MTIRITQAANGARRFERFERRSLQLSQAQWERLEALARELGVQSEGGARIGSPSWRTVVRLIGKGDLRVGWAKGKA